MKASSSGAGPEITDLLQAWSSSDAEALGRLMPEVVDDLRRMARRYFSQERPSHTLEPTALVNEVYVRLVGRKTGLIADREQFFAFAARLMRQILADHARARRAEKRGGGRSRVPLDHVLPARGGLDPETLIALDEALDRLGELDSRQRAIVEMRYFAGLTMPEIARTLGISVPTVERGWTVARRWLAREMGERSRSAGSPETGSADRI